MKKLDLNIKLKEEVMGEDGKTPMKPSEIAKNWIGVMLERAINQPDTRTRQATKAVGLPVQRQYFKVMDTLDGAKDGIVEMEDELFSFMDRKCHQAELPVQKGIAEVLVRIDDAINLAKVPVKKEKKEGGDEPK